MNTLPGKLKVLAIAIGLSASFAASASSNIAFDPDGNAATATTVNFSTLDQRPGNALAIGVNANSAVGTQFNLLYQSNLGSALNTNGDGVFTQGDTVGGAARFFTFTAGFREVITGNSIVGGNGVLTFGFASPATMGPTASNFFYMYATSASGSNLNGTGFTSGAAILSGHFVSSGYSSFFATNGSQGPLDQNGGNDYPNVNSILGSGATSATLVIDSFDTAFFPNLRIGATSSLINTSQNLAFAQADPSALFSTTGTTAGGTTAGVSSVGTINGINGANTVFQADANQSFTVPEPMPTALIGVGLLGMALARRKSKAAKA